MILKVLGWLFGMSLTDFVHLRHVFGSYGSRRATKSKGRPGKINAFYSVLSQSTSVQMVHNSRVKYTRRSACFVPSYFDIKLNCITPKKLYPPFLEKTQQKRLLHSGVFFQDLLDSSAQMYHRHYHHHY